ncbi:P-loop NTPase fold protein [Clostridium aestuarii]|uniref:P-loop NTPase fold protein n=1 Tax=Clostridium aestuarii TaxID=338193 RepID=A0ABT4CXZ5_9CLOT|nr:P-loop NTPase fold protein [Clostridium aestuarii]MCY6483854.1 P-loop NTPase fold protein [Clostridium aestuarii]
MSADKSIDNIQIDILKNAEEEKNDIMLKDENIKLTFKLKNNVKCSVEGCNHIAEYATFLFKEYKYGVTSYCIDNTCPYLCSRHMKDNEESCIGNREPEITVKYKYTNKNNMVGYTKYFKLEIKFGLKILEEHCKDDYLNISKDIEAFVNLIVHEDLRLPLTIGIFGGWGAGKTFFADSLVKMIKSNLNDKCVIVPFNAWNYYDSNIVVNLVYKIFDTINNKIREIKHDDNNNEFLKELNHYKEFLKEDKFNNIKELNHKISILEENLKNNKKKLIEHIINNISSVVGEIDEFKSLLNQANDINDNIRELEQEFKKVVSLISVIKENYKSVIWIAILGTVISVSLPLLKYSKIHSGISEILTFILVGVKLTVKYISRITNNKLLKKVLSEVGPNIQRINDRESCLTILKSKRNKRECEFNQLNDDNITISFLRDYIMKKLATNGYRDNMGFINTVKEDIDNLNSIINTKVINDKELNLNKIILVVDDLDRCPEEKVVQVLQAIQLLLSTDMFIVILAVDSKWIDNCITSIYDKMINNKKNNNENKNFFAINYLEKIIHIPFWIEPLSIRNSSSFIKKLGEEITFKIDNDASDDLTETISDEKENKTNIKENKYNEDVKFSMDEVASGKNDEDSEKRGEDNLITISLTDNDINLISKIDFLFDNTSPRKIKRFFNTVLLIKYKHYYDENMYRLLLTGAASIILKPNIFCEFYKDIFGDSIGKETENASDIINEQIQSEKYKAINIRNIVLSKFSKYVKQNFSQVTMKKFEDIVYEASKYTYYHGEIFQYKLQ